MPPVNYAMWTHGHSMQIEYPERVLHVARFGSHISVEGKPGTDNWFHFAIPTPVIAHGARTFISSVLIEFATRSTDAIVRHVHVYDGRTKIAEHNDINLSGNIGLKRFDVAAYPAAQLGVGISVGVEFGVDPKSHIMDFFAAGCDFGPLLVHL